MINKQHDRHGGFRETLKTKKMKQLVLVEQISSKNVADIKNEVVSQMQKFGYNVVADEQAARKFFLTEFGKDMSSETAQSFQIDGELNGDWQTTITVTIKAHFCDSGSDDYLYTVEVVED